MSIATRIQSMYENVGEVYDTITNVTLPEHKNIENIPRTIRDSYLEIINNGINVIYDNWEKVVGEGTSLSLTPTEEAPMDIVYKGNTYQDSTTGKNLFSGDFSQFDSTGGEGTTYGYFKLPKANTRYTLTVIAKKDFTPTNYTYLGFTGNGGNAQAGYYWIVAGNMETFVKGSTKSIGNLYGGNILEYVSLFNNNEQTLERFNEYFDIQLEEGETATDYEPYTNGASPNPSYPQEVHTVSGNNTITTSKDGFENIELESGYIDSNNVIQSATGWKHSDYIDITGYEYYVVDMNLGNAPKSILYDSNKQPIQVFSIQYQGTYNLSNYPSAKYIRISSQEVYLNKQHLIVKSDYQVNLPIRNLCDIENIDKVGVYATYTYSNGVITMTPTQTTNACRLQFVIPKSYFEIGKKYTLSCIGANKFAIGYASSVSDTSHFNYFASANSGNSLSFTYTSIPDNYVCFYLYNKEATLGTEWTIANIQVELGDKKNSFTPYGTTPIELCKIGTYQDKIDKSTGKNLFDESNMYSGYYEVTPPYNLTSDNAYRTMIIDNLPKGTYTFKTTLNSPSLLRIMYDNENHSIGQNTDTYTFTTTTNGKVMLSFRNQSSSAITETFYTMLNSGSTALPYEPYGTSWYLKKEIGKVEITNDNKNIITSYGTNNNHIKVDILKTNLGWQKSYLSGIALLNSYREVTTTSAINTGTFNTNISDTNLRIYNDNFTDLANAQDTLVGTIIYIALATPTYTLIEGELLNQLEAIKMSYEGQTNISQTNNDLAFILNPTALEKV